MLGVRKIRSIKLSRDPRDPRDVRSGGNGKGNSEIDKSMMQILIAKSVIA